MLRSALPCGVGGGTGRLALDPGPLLQAAHLTPSAAAAARPGTGSASRARWSSRWPTASRSHPRRPSDVASSGRRSLRRPRSRQTDVYATATTRSGSAQRLGPGGSAAGTSGGASHARPLGPAPQGRGASGARVAWRHPHRGSSGPRATAAAPPRTAHKDRLQRKWASRHTRAQPHPSAAPAVHERVRL
jgi:hypothetical protein